MNEILEKEAPADNAIYDTPMEETNNSNYFDETVNSLSAKQ